MSVAYQMPVCTDLATKVGPRMWWKPILKKGHISKGGVELDVDDALYERLIASFQAGAKDQVQFLAGHADDSNLNAFQGDLKGLEARPDGKLWGLFSVTDRADRMLAENPQLGASVSVVDRFERADGRQYGPTLLHVAGTFDPEIGNLGAWVRAELAASQTQVVDLTAPVEAPRTGAITSAGPGGEVTEPEEAGPVAQLNEEELAAIRSVLPIFQKAVDEPAPPTVDTPDTVAEAEFTEADIDAALTADTDDEPEVAEPELVAASAEHGEALELANARIDAQQVELARLRHERDTERYAAEVIELAKDFGIPSDVTEIARPLLFGTGHTVDLSAGKTADAGQIVRKVLHELGRRYTKALDLGVEYGTAAALSDTERRNRELNDWVASAGAELQGK